VKDETKMSATQQWMADHPNDVPCPKGNSAAWRRKRGLDKAGAARQRSAPAWIDAVSQARFVMADGDKDRFAAIAARGEHILKRRRGGRVKVSGARPKHRLDRPSRRKFADGGTTDAESDQSAQTTASPGDTPRSGVDALMQIPKIRAIAAGLSGIQKVDQKSPVWRMRHRSGSRCDTAAPSSSGTLPMFAAMRRTLQPSCGNCRRTD
jgi:hypothetical protein